MTRIELTDAQARQVFVDQLNVICGDYKIRDLDVYDVTTCGRDDCNGHEEKIDETTPEGKRRVAAILLRELL